MLNEIQPNVEFILSSGRTFSGVARGASGGTRPGA